MRKVDDAVVFGDDAAEAVRAWQAALDTDCESDGWEDNANLHQAAMLCELRDTTVQSASEVKREALAAVLPLLRHVRKHAGWVVQDSALVALYDALMAEHPDIRAMVEGDDKSQWEGE